MAAADKPPTGDVADRDRDGDRGATVEPGGRSRDGTGRIPLETERPGRTVEVILAPVMRDWTDAELRTLATVAETLVRGDGTTRARLAADGLTSAADPAQVKQLRQALRLMESRAVNLALAGRPTPFSAMPLEARERYLLSWGASRLALRRSAFQALRKLLSFLAYAEPGADGPNPLLTEIGYEADRPPVTARPRGDRAAPLPRGPGPADRGASRSMPTSSWWARAPVAASSRPSSPRPADRSSCSRPDRSSTNRRCRPTSSRRSTGCTWTAASSRPGTASVTILAGSAVGGGTLVNWMTSIEAPAAVREEWARDHGLEGLEDGAAWSEDVAAVEADARRRRVHPHPAQGRDPPARRPGARLGGGPDPARRDGLRRLRELPVRLPPRGEAVRDPGAPGDGGRGGRPDRARRGGLAGPASSTGGPPASRRASPTVAG